MNGSDARTFDCAYYEANYPDYDAQNPESKLRHYSALLERHRSADLPRRVHDIGCAFGKFLRSLGPSWEVYGSDVSEFAIARAAELYPGGRFRVADNTNGPAFDEKFSVVTAFDVLEHVPDLDALGRSIEAQLLDGGLFVFAVPVYDGLSGPVIRRLDRDPTHVHKWPRKQWLDWARKRFAILQWHGILRYLFPWKTYLHVPTRLFREHTPAILVVASKPSNPDPPATRTGKSSRERNSGRESGDSRRYRGTSRVRRGKR